jgi:hypothetical protein
MPRAVWSALSLLVLTHVALAAQGVHPGPLPAPLGSDAGGSGSGQAEPDRYGSGHGYGSGYDPGYGPGYGAGPRESAGHGPPPGPGGASSSRGYWQWVPMEPSGHDDYDYGRGEPAYRGQVEGYPQQGYAPPSARGFGDSRPGGFAPPAYERQWPGYPSTGSGFGDRAEGYYPAPGYPGQPPGGGWDTAPSRPPQGPPPERR